MLWAELLFNLREQMDNVKTDYHRNEQIWIIDDEIPKIYEGKAIGKLTSAEEPTWTVECEGDEFRHTYPCWCMFASLHEAEKTLTALKRDMNKN
jgi:hypothetical protein